MKDIPTNLFKGRHPSTFIKFVNLINRLDRDGKGCYAKDEWLARKLEVSIRTIERYTAKGKTLNYLSVINNDKRSRLMLGYDSLRKQFKQEQKAPKNSQQNINPTFEKPSMNKRPSMNTHETVGFLTRHMRRDATL